MKKIVLIASIALFVSCNNNDVENVDSFNSLGFKTVKYNSINKNTGTKIIEFNNMESYENMINQLNEDVENWDDNFVATYGHLDDDALNDKEEELNFDDEKPLSDFENENNFISLRNKYFIEENIWLNNEELKDSNNPMNKEFTLLQM